MADMYHTTDMDTESLYSNTSPIRKKFHEAILEIKYKCHLIEDVEAFLVNTNDMDRLNLLFNQTIGHPGCGPDPLDGQMKMHGVKIIESQYVPEGTIFKVFKNKEDMWCPESTSTYRSDGSLIGTSGFIPNWNQPMPPGIQAPPASDCAYQGVPDDKEVEQTEPTEKRHSTKRRIELEE